MTEWISVKDGLPSKENEFVAVLINGLPVICHVHDATLSLDINSVSFYWPTKRWCADPLYAKVTHWMPLPVPTKDEP